MRFFIKAFACVIFTCNSFALWPPIQNPAGNANLYGYARVSKETPDIDLGSDAYDLCIQFCSNPDNEPGFLGAYWDVPFLSSNILQTDGNRLKWQCPNRTFFYFEKNRDSSLGAGAALKKKANKSKYEMYFDTTGMWCAYKTADNSVKVESISNGKECYIYKNGKMTRFENDNGSFDISYKKNKLASVKSASTRRELISVNYGDDGNHAQSMTVDGKTFKFEYHDRNPGDILSKGQWDKNTKLLKSITDPDGNVESFSYEMKWKKPRRILHENFTESRTKDVNIDRITFSDASGSQSWIEWCAQTGMITADSGGEYAVGNNLSDKLHPAPTNKPTPTYVAIKYERASHEFPQLYYYNWSNTNEIVGDSKTGDVYRYIKMAGNENTYRLDRKVEKLKKGSSIDNNPIWELQKTNYYDNNGRIIREIDGDGTRKFSRRHHQHLCFCA